MNVVFYARVSSDRQDVDLSIAAQLRALRDYAAKSGYQVVREYVDEAESGRTAHRPRFQQMIAEARRASKPFELILVWKYSRFARSREDAIAFKSLLKKHGVRVVSITEPSDDSPTGKLMEAIIESLDEFYSANLGQEILRGMRESASRGFYVVSRAPYGYQRVRVPDGRKERARLEPDPHTAPVVQRIFDHFLRSRGITEVVQALNSEGIAAPRGGSWSKTVLHKLLVNEAYTGTLVWGKHSKLEKAHDPVRVENAWESLVDREIFDQVQTLLHSRDFDKAHPRRTASQFLLSGLAKCGGCGKAFSGREAKSGKFSYYVCGTLVRQGAGTCTTPYLPKEKFESLVVETLKPRVLTDKNLEKLAAMVAEEMDGMTTQWREHLDTMEGELVEVGNRLGRLYEALETGKLSLDDLAPRIQELRERQEKLQRSREAVQEHLRGRKQEVVNLQAIKAYAADLRGVLSEGTLTEQKSFIRSFVKEIEVRGGDGAVLRYTMPMPPDNAREDYAAVLPIVTYGGAQRTVLELSAA